MGIKVAGDQIKQRAGSALARRINLATVLVLPSVMLVSSIVLYAFPLLSVVPFIILYVAVFVGNLIFAIVDYKKSLTHDMSYALMCPLSLSIFMNVYLGSMAHAIPRSLAAVLLSSSILYCFVVAVGAFIIDLSHSDRNQLAVFAAALLFTLVAYAGALFIVNPTGLTAFASALRNLITPCAFLLLGSVLAARIRIDSLLDYILIFGFFVMAFGLFEILVFPNFWRAANISDLWGLKGISVPDGGLPANFYSSEKIGGVQVRRMSSLFADPVNLGTFLFALFVVAWYRRRRVLVAMSVLCCLLTVSKGALMGFLIWVLVYCLEKSRNKWVKRMVLASVILSGVVFIVYSQLNSTGSVAAHMRGFFGGVASMIENPFGYGCGNVGVLAGLANENVLRSVEESGFGVIAGESGVVGVVTYIALFVVVLRVAYLRTDGDLRILLVTLLLSIYANIMFNEVALSPNSCGVYFSLLGILSMFSLNAFYEPKHLRIS